MYLQMRFLGMCDLHYMIVDGCQSDTDHLCTQTHTMFILHARTGINTHK